MQNINKGKVSVDSFIRICGVEIPVNNQILLGLTKIYGIGLSRSKYICKKYNIDFFLKIKKINKIKMNNIKNEIRNFTIENDLRKEVNFNIKRLIDLKCYRGVRHYKKLPVRGQRTRTNARTRKGPKKILFKK